MGNGLMKEGKECINAPIALHPRITHRHIFFHSFILYILSLTHYLIAYCHILNQLRFPANH